MVKLSTLDGRQVFKQQMVEQWINITTADLEGESITNIVHHEMSNGEFTLEQEEPLITRTICLLGAFQQQSSIKYSFTKLVTYYKME